MMASSSPASTPMRSPSSSRQETPAMLFTPHGHHPYHIIHGTSVRSSGDAVSHHIMSPGHPDRLPAARRLYAHDTSSSLPRSYSRDETVERGHRTGKGPENDPTRAFAGAVPREVVAQHPPRVTAASSLEGASRRSSSAPLYATSKTALWSLCPIAAPAASRPVIFDIAVQDLGAGSTPADVVLSRLVTLCAECHLHSHQLVESAMQDLARYITAHEIGGDLEYMDDLLTKWTSHLSVPEALVHSLKTHLPHTVLCRDACRILSHIGKLSFALSPHQCTSSTAAVQAVLVCLEHHAGDADLVHEALEALIHMGSHFPYHEALFGIETMRFLVDSVLRQHMERPEIQVDTLFLLGNLSCNLALAPGIVEAGGIPALLESLNLHWQDTKVNEGGVLALFKLCKWSRARTQAVLEHGGYATVFRMTKVHPEGRVGTVARATLELLS